MAEAAVAGAIVGDGFSFWLGHRYHETLRTWWPLNAHPEWLARGHAQFAAHGGNCVFPGRVVPARDLIGAFLAQAVTGLASPPLIEVSGRSYVPVRQPLHRPRWRTASRNSSRPGLPSKRSPGPSANN